MMSTGLTIDTSMLSNGAGIDLQGIINDYVTESGSELICLKALHKRANACRGAAPRLRGAEGRHR